MRRDFMLAHFRLRIVVIAHAHAVGKRRFHAYLVRVAVPSDAFVRKLDSFDFCLVYGERCAKACVHIVFGFDRCGDFVHAGINIFRRRAILDRGVFGRARHFNTMRKPVIRHFVGLKLQIDKFAEFLPFCVQL